MKNYIVALLVLVIAMSACKSTTTIIEQGDYDAAINKSLSRLVGKKKKKADEVAALELAFSKATDRDIAKIESLKRSNRGEVWEEIYSMTKKIARRQKSIEPLLPLVDENGYQAKFKFVKVNQLVEESRSKAAKHLYRSAENLLLRAAAGDKQAAREAYGKLDRIERYYDTYLNRRDLMLRARQLGMVYITFKMVNESNAILPRDFEKEILTMDLKGMNSLWETFHLIPQENIQYDYEAIMELKSIDISPERIVERNYREEKEIEDGTRVARDEDDNVLKDSLGNVIEVPVIKIISADIVEVLQTKSAIVGGDLMVINKYDNNLLDQQPIAAEAIFEHYASTYQGDRRALTAETRRRIGNRPIDFPTDAQLLFDAASVLKPILKEKLERATFR